LSDWLIDTQACLWFLADDPQLSEDAKSTMEAADEVLLISTASLWEMAIKSSLGRLDVPDDLPEVLADQGFSTLEITTDHAWEVRHLTLGDHRDPFDRMLAAQARVEELPIISSDKQLDQYGIRRHW
jgi:PIN domain nuclease of toxin-antitoxin system